MGRCRRRVLSHTERLPFNDANIYPRRYSKKTQSTFQRMLLLCTAHNDFITSLVEPGPFLSSAMRLAVAKEVRSISCGRCSNGCGSASMGSACSTLPPHFLDAIRIAVTSSSQMLRPTESEARVNEKEHSMKSGQVYYKSWLKRDLAAMGSHERGSDPGAATDISGGRFVEMVGICALMIQLDSFRLGLSLAPLQLPTIVADV